MASNYQAHGWHVDIAQKEQFEMNKIMEKTMLHALELRSDFRWLRAPGGLGGVRCALSALKANIRFNNGIGGRGEGG